MMAVREDLAISNGAACTSASYSASHVLKAMGLSDALISSAVRISWGPGIKDIPAELIVAAVRSLRG
jgi:cysteine desulfurase